VRPVLVPPVLLVPALLATVRPGLLLPVPVQLVQGLLWPVPPLLAPPLLAPVARWELLRLDWRIR
jgi:hypothetical protein